MLVQQGEGIAIARVYPLDADALEAGITGQHALGLDERRCGSDRRIIQHTAKLIAPAGQGHVVVDSQVRDHIENTHLDFPVEAVHDRQHHNQRNNTQGHGAKGQAGDNREKAFALLAAHIAKANKEGENVFHRRH